MFIPSMLLKQLYTHGSLQKTEDGLCFMLKNRLKDAHLEEILQISLDGKHISNEKITLKVGPDTLLSAEEVNASGNVPFPLREVITVFLDVKAKAGPEKLKLGIEFKAAPFGKLKFTVEDNISPIADKPAGIPRDPHDDYRPEIIEQRQQFFIPVIFMEDTTGFLPGREQESGGIVQAGRAMLDAIIDLRTPRFLVLIRNAIGGAYASYNNYPTGADLVVALPTTRVAVMGPPGMEEMVGQLQNMMETMSNKKTSKFLAL